MTGSLTVGGDLTGYSDPDGRLHVRGDIAAAPSPSGVARIRVAETREDPFAQAFGELLVDGGISGPGARALTAGTLRVGLTEGTGSATGHLHLDHALAQLDGGLELGDGATLELGIDGPTRGARYAAIDTPTALLDGILRLSSVRRPRQARCST